VREMRARAIEAVKPWIQLLGDRRQCPEVRKAMEVLLRETREEYESTLEMKTAKAEVVQELQDRASQQEWMIRQLVDVVEILEDALLCTPSVPVDLELFFADVLAQPVSEELRTRSVSCLRVLSRCGAAARRALNTLGVACGSDSAAEEADVTLEMPDMEGASMPLGSFPLHLGRPETEEAQTSPGSATAAATPTSPLEEDEVLEETEGEADEDAAAEEEPRRGGYVGGTAVASQAVPARTSAEAQGQSEGPGGHDRDPAGTGTAAPTSPLDKVPFGEKGLIVAQSFRKVAVLLSFLEVFGGTISRHSNGKGLCQPMLCWHVGGFPARLAAHALAANSITKRKQLQLAAAWPWERCGQEACRDELRALKKYDSAEAGPCSLGYFTGFFDAEGCLCHLGGARLSLQVKQKFPTVLQCLREFLAENYGCVHLYGYKTHSALSVSRTSICKEVLRAMLSSGLICKAEQAKLAIGLTPQNSLPVRLALGEQVGNQSFGRRLDEDGLERARKIQSAMSRATVLKDQGRLMEADTKLQQVQLMKGKHKLLNALRENEQLRQYIGNIRALQSHTDQPLFSVGKLWAL
ncbi:pum, partial [Symbiodinium pilosum]